MKSPALVVIWLIVYLLYVAGCLAFGVFYGKQEDTGTAYLKGFGIALVLLVLGFLHGVLGVGAMVAATFYVADRKNRSRFWAGLAIVLGPIALLVITLLPKQPDTSTLSIT